MGQRSQMTRIIPQTGQNYPLRSPIAKFTKQVFNAWLSFHWMMIPGKKWRKRFLIIDRSNLCTWKLEVMLWIDSVWPGLYIHCHEFDYHELLPRFEHQKNNWSDISGHAKSRGLSLLYPGSLDSLFEEIWILCQVLKNQSLEPSISRGTFWDLAWVPAAEVPPAVLVAVLLEARVFLGFPSLLCPIHDILKNNLFFVFCFLICFLWPGVVSISCNLGIVSHPGAMRPFHGGTHRGPWEPRFP